MKKQLTILSIMLIISVIVALVILYPQTAGISIIITFSIILLYFIASGIYDLYQKSNKQ